MMTTSNLQRLLLTTFALIALNAPSVAGFGGWGNGNGGPGRWNENGGGWAGCAWWTGDDDCNDNAGNGGGGSSSDSSSNNPSQLQFSTSDGARYDKIITIHAVLACLVWVLFIPLGGILIRSTIKTGSLAKLHGVIQCMSYLLYIVAAAMGIYLVQELSYGNYSMWSDPHTKLGVAILALAFFMPILGTVHHKMYKKRAAQFKEGGPKPGRTIPGYMHLWGGRVLILLGIVNGGLGIRLASNSPFSDNSDKKLIAYSICAAIMFTLYVVFVVRGEVRRFKQRKESREDVRGVPMVEPTYRTEESDDSDTIVPPTYEQSQTNSDKHVESTARYSF